MLFQGNNKYIILFRRVLFLENVSVYYVWMPYVTCIDVSLMNVQCWINTLLALIEQ